MRGDLRGYVDAAARAFDPDVLTIGFARRVATYKRLEILTRDPDWTLRLLDGDRPVQVVLAGKAHPRDEEAKRTLQAVFGLKAARVVGERVVFLDDYDLAIGPGAGARLRRVAQPAPPAPGGQRHERDEERLQRRAAAQRARRVVGRGLRRRQRLGASPARSTPTTTPRTSATPPPSTTCSTTRCCPRSTTATSPGCPRRWIELMRASLRTLGPMFSASRMLAEYVEGPYRG